MHEFLHKALELGLETFMKMLFLPLENCGSTLKQQ